MSGTPERHVSRFHILAYILPALPLAALGLPIVVHLPQFYASSEIGMSLAVTGLVFSLARIADVFIDPAMGYLSDRLSTRWGRRRPMVVAGTPVLALGLWMVFVPGGPVSPWYLGGWLFVMYLGLSMTMIPHLSWGAELSTDYHERSQIYGWSHVATIAGMVGVLVLPAVLEHEGGHDLSVQIMAMAIFAIALLIPAVALCVGVLPEPEVKLGGHAPLIPTLRFLVRDMALRRVVLVDLFASITGGAIGAMFFFFARTALALPDWAGTLLLVYFISGVACIPLWIWLSRKLGKHNALMVSFGYTFLAMPMFFFIPPGNLAVALPLFAVSGVNYGAPAFLLRAMMADIADADAAENNAERAGLMYSFLTLTSKFGMGAAVGISFTMLGWLGFNPSGANNPATIAHLEDFFIALPIAFAAVNGLIMRGYPLDEVRQRQIRAEVERRRAGRPALEPFAGEPPDAESVALAAAVPVDGSSPAATEKET